MPYYRCPFQNLLEVVEEQQQALLLEVALEGFHQGPLRALLEPERSRDGGGHQFRVGYGGEGDEEDSIVELLQEIGTGLQGEAGLAGASWARECEQSHLFTIKTLRDLLDLALPAHERGGLQGKIVGVALERFEGRE